MRLCVALALISLLASPPALAAKKKPRKAKVTKAGPSLDTKDPAHTERSDEGPFAPKGVTGALREEPPPPPAPPPPEARPRDPVLAFGDVVLASGQAPVPAPIGQSASREASLAAIVLGAQLDVSPTFTLGLRIPGSAASIELPSRDGNESAFALGSPQILGEFRVQLAALSTLPVTFGVGVPLAQGDPDPSSLDASAVRLNNVNLLADAARGYREGELYWPKRLPVVVGLGFRHETEDFDFHAGSKLIAGLNLGAELNNGRIFGGEGHLVLNGVALRNVTGAGIVYRFLDEPSLAVGLDTWVAYNAIQAVEFESDAKPSTPLQLVVEPRVLASFGKLRPSLGLLLPIGGRLGDTGITSLRLHIDYAL